MTRPHAPTGTLLRQLRETRQAWIMYVSRKMRPRPTTIAGLEKKMARIHEELRMRGYQWNP